MVSRMLKDLARKEPDASVSVDEAVAHGAALHASIILARSRGETPILNIKNVNSHSLGVVASDPRTNRRRNAILIPRNTTLPVTAKRVFRTQKAGQKSILVQIVEGESASPEDCSQIGKCVVRDLPPELPAQSPIEVWFAYEENGRLNVRVVVPGTGLELEHQLARENSMTPEQLDAWRLYIAGQAMPDPQLQPSDEDATIVDEL
jgi:molecular chaperone DnaK